MIYDGREYSNAIVEASKLISDGGSIGLTTEEKVVMAQDVVDRYEELVYSARPSAMPDDVWQAGQWQDISTAPKDGRDILVFDCRTAGGHMNVVAYAEEDAPNVWETQEFAVYHAQAFTHWMPLPEAPKGGAA